MLEPHKITEVWNYPDEFQKHKNEIKKQLDELNSKITKVNDSLNLRIKMLSAFSNKNNTNNSGIINEKEFEDLKNKLIEDFKSNNLINNHSTHLENNTNSGKDTANLIQLTSESTLNGSINLKFQNSKGQISKIGIKQFIPDDVTISAKGNKLSLKYNWDNSTIVPETTANGDNVISVYGVKTSTGDTITGDQISSKITSLDSELNLQLSRLKSSITKIESQNNYLFANNFGDSVVPQETLTEYSIKSLEIENKNYLPNGIKVKNLHDNHVWVLNILRDSEGLSQYKWEDIGVDNIGIATNNGALGVVKGSQEIYRGFIDVNGNISINGLEETLDKIFAEIENLKNKNQ